MEVSENANKEKLIQQMESIGYMYEPQPDNPEPHMMFMKGYTPQGFRPPVYHIHVRYSGDWNEIHFRDYQIAHPEAVKEYGELKLALKEKFVYNRDGYTDAKTEFVQKIMNLAKPEQNRNNQ
ncbi:MAG: GrpB family protein [Tannerellaceae bacterium]|nr:GrpB family protein [Tannerellaceae bacterium]